jgi:membrane-associated phospholipid phosphatase
VIIILLLKLTDKYPENKKLLLLKRIMVVPIIFFVYYQVQIYIKVVNPNIYDNLLIRIDYYIFGTNPTDLLSKISFPVITEYLQFSYMSYFLIPLILGIELHFRREKKQFSYFIGLLIFSFYLSYLLYFFLPAIGPRFTLYEFSELSNQLPGLLLTDFFRDLINYGGGIINATQNPALIVNRDCMPSGHTLITSINIFVAFKLKSKFRWLIFILGVSLIFGTVYLRYHYVIDLIVSLMLVPIVLWIEPKINHIFTNRAGKSAN